MQALASYYGAIMVFWPLAIYSNMDKRLLGVFLISPFAFKVFGGDLAKRLLGADSALAPRSLLPRSPQHQGVFWPDHTPILKVPNLIPGV